ncbi:MAG: stage III sporulation protein AD [Anaerovoracaceae bacterium]|uniref:Stage III sporulation protein AD n=1 Tax=Candidatus Allocopromorpha excrementipullorum TaxID=2840743 RepID=A0A9D1SUI4_9FIRM|nr:stage III sporulation protein AD [Candidatus Copromorpha excrementipullorum]
MEILKIVATALTGLILAIVMKSVNKEISIYIVLGTVMIIFLSVADRLAEIFSFLQGIYDNVTYGRTFFPVILKVLAVAYITDFTAQLCRDAGEASIGSKVELAGKIIIFYLAMPILTAILELIKTLLG